MAKQITNIQQVESKSKTHDVRQIHNGFIVTSGASGKEYFVRLDPASCTCKWAEYQPEGKPVACSHVMKVRQFVAERDGYRAKFRSVTDDIKHLHRKTERLGNGVQITLRKV